MIENIFGKIKYCTIDESTIQGFGSEHEFMTLTVDLMVEVGQYICLAACILPGDRKTWSLKEAILGGHLVRLYKLIHAVLDQTCQHRRETTVVFGRMAFECIINLKFFLKNASDELFESYIHYSLKHEKRLGAEILENIETRGGKVLEIEQRMLNSIDKAFKKSETTPEQIKSKNLKNWGEKNLFEKARDVGLEKAYLAAIGATSQRVHGNWQELLEYNLEEKESGFVPLFEWHTPRPQLPNAISFQAVGVTIEYLDYLKYLSPKKIEEIIEKLKDLSSRIIFFDQLHERFLSAKQSNKA